MWPHIRNRLMVTLRRENVWVTHSFTHESMSGAHSWMNVWRTGEWLTFPQSRSVSISIMWSFVRMNAWVRETVRLRVRPLRLGRSKVRQLYAGQVLPAVTNDFLFHIQFRVWWMNTDSKLDDGWGWTFPAVTLPRRWVLTPVNAHPPGV